MEPSRIGAIAVSQDLEALGLTFGTIVVIDGMGSFRVDDRMNRRWVNRIDILHANLKAARNFAKRDLTIRWVGRK
jgi:3D (Asp-Asp-Asp) domain-containing protein